jgi:hypothetical protein
MKFGETIIPSGNMTHFVGRCGYKLTKHQILTKENDLGWALERKLKISDLNLHL